MIVRKEQIKTLEEQISENFLTELQAQLRKVAGASIFYQSADATGQTALLRRLIHFISQRGAYSQADYEYFCYLCYKHGLDVPQLNADIQIVDTFAVPGRSIEDKLFSLHHYLEFLRVKR